MTWNLIALLFFASLLPVVIAAAIVLGYRRSQVREGRRSPLANKTIASPGEQLRVRINDLDDQIAAGMFLLFFVGPYTVASWAIRRIDPTTFAFRWTDLIWVAMYVAITAGAIWHVVKVWQKLRRSRAGLQAELFAANELNRLIGAGCTVLHDVPGDGFNIDHVVVGPRAVYAIETKSVRKPKATDAGGHYKVQYDGEMLRFPDFATKSPLVQSRQQAEWLGRYLAQATNTSVQVVPVLALPGWWIDSKPVQAGDVVRVINPAGRGAAFMGEERGPRSITAGNQALIAQALLMRFPVALE